VHLELAGDVYAGTVTHWGRPVRGGKNLPNAPNLSGTAYGHMSGWHLLILWNEAKEIVLLIIVIPMPMSK
jgi:hypothetical protein